MALIKPRGAPASAAVETRAPSESLLESFKAQVKLDRHALDLAAEEQPELFLRVAEQQVLAISRRDQSKDELLRTDARLGREAREEIVKSGVKATEGGVADIVLGKPEHVAAADKVSALNREVDEWSALRSALEHRKSMIRELATLYASGYYTAGASDNAGRKARDAGAAAGREALARARDERKD